MNKTVWQSYLGVGGATFGSLPDHRHYYPAGSGREAINTSDFSFTTRGGVIATTNFVSDNYSGTVYSKVETQVVPSSIFINFYIKY